MTAATQARRHGDDTSVGTIDMAGVLPSRLHKCVCLKSPNAGTSIIEIV